MLSGVLEQIANAVGEQCFGGMQIMRCINRTIVSLVCGFLCAAVVSNASAQKVKPSDNRNVQVDCQHFAKCPGGLWTATQQATVQIGTSSVTVSSGGKPQGSINNSDIQEEINRRCLETVSKPSGSEPAPVFAKSNWMAKKITVSECLDRAGLMFQDFPAKQTAGETVFAFFNGYTFVLRCTPRSLIFMAVVGPPKSTAEQNRTVEGLFDQILDRF